MADVFGISDVFRQIFHIRQVFIFRQILGIGRCMDGILSWLRRCFQGIQTRFGQGRQPPRFGCGPGGRHLRAGIRYTPDLRMVHA
jgi:hypothetical protein